MYFYVLGLPALDEIVIMATGKGLSMICNFQIFANTNLGKFTKYECSGLGCFGVLRHLLGREWNPPMLIGLRVK